MHRLTLAAIALAVFASSLQAQSAYDASRIALYSSVAFDLGTTETFMGHGQFELNPILGQNPYRRIGLNVAAAAGLDLATHWAYRHDHPKLAIALNFAVSGIHFTAGILNIRDTQYVPQAVTSLARRK